MHFKEIARRVTSGGSTLYVAVATLGTKARRRAFQQAIEEVCQYRSPRWCEVVVAHWDSATSWGLQVADYGLWAVQRRLERGDDKYMWAVQPHAELRVPALGHGMNVTGYPALTGRSPLDLLLPVVSSRRHYGSAVKHPALGSPRRVHAWDAASHGCCGPALPIAARRRGPPWTRQSAGSGRLFT